MDEFLSGAVGSGRLCCCCWEGGGCALFLVFFPPFVARVLSRAFGEGVWHCGSKICRCYAVTFLNPTPISDWYVVR